MDKNVPIHKIATVTLRIARNSMAFATQNETAIGGISYEPYVVKSSMSMAANLREAFLESPLLQGNFQRAQLLLDSPVLLMPLEEFNEQDVAPLFHYTFLGYENEELLNTVLPAQKTVAIYPINKDLKLVLTDHFQDLRIMPLMQPGWSPVYKRSFIGMRKKLFAYFRGTQMDAFCFTQNRFRFANSFEISNESDAVYFLLHIWKTLGYNIHDDEMHLMGEFNNREQLIKELKDYVKNVFVINPSAEFNRAPITQIKGIPLDLMTLYINGR